MADTFTLTLSGSSSTLDANYFPPLELAANKNYYLGLVELLTFNSIPNIDIGKNEFYVGNRRMNIPPGSYELRDIEEYLRRQLPKDVTFKLRANNNTLRSEILCSDIVDFQPPDSLGELLGFRPRTLQANFVHESDMPVKILAVNALRVECNITAGAYINEQRVHTIHEFFPNVPPGYKIIEVPKQVIYHPITVRAIHHLQLRIVDQDGESVNFRGETITIRLHVKSE